MKDAIQLNELRFLFAVFLDFFFQFNFLSNGGQTDNVVLAKLNNAFEKKLFVPVKNKLNEIVAIIRRNTPPDILKRREKILAITVLSIFPLCVIVVLILITIKSNLQA